jgi:hypothetical protein
MQPLEAQPLLEVIPEPGVIRNRLAQLVRERVLLRGLLKLSEQKQEAAGRDRVQRQEVRHA